MAVDQTDLQIRLESVRLAIDARRGPYPMGTRSIASLAAEIYLFVRGDTAPETLADMKGWHVSLSQDTETDKADVGVG